MFDNVELVRSHFDYDPNELNMENIKLGDK